MKRLFDVMAALAGIIILLPVFMIVAILIWLDDRGPIFFVQNRIGQFGKPFPMFKFRSMFARTEANALQITVGNDPRITRIGKWLRRTKLDELPQLLNVFMGHMSFVGPRPEVPKYVAYYSETQRQVLALRPGITDPASIKYRNEASILAESSDPEHRYVTEILPDKIQMNMEYAKHATLRGDVMVIIKTIFGHSETQSTETRDRYTKERSVLGGAREW